MARTNHKIVNKLMNELRSRITDKQFFTSRALAGYFEDIAAAQTKRYNYNRRIHVNLSWEPAEKEVAYTDNYNICINCGYPLVTAIKGRRDRFEMVMGLFAHELGHVLFTDFLKAQSHTLALSKGRWYPYPPELNTVKEKENEKSMWAYIMAEEVNMQMFLKMVHSICNILEDGYIEQRMLNQFPGTLGFGLEYSRKVRFDDIPTVTRMIEKEEEGSHIYITLCQMMLSYALYGVIKYGEEPLTDIRIQTVFGLIDDIDRAVMESSAKTRFDMVNRIIVKLWEYIGDYFEKTKEIQKEMLAAGKMAPLEDMIEGELEGLSGVTAVMRSGGAAVSGDENGEMAGSKTSSGSSSAEGSTASADNTKGNETSNRLSAARAGTHEDAEKEDTEHSGGNASRDGNEDDYENKLSDSSEEVFDDTSDNDGSVSIGEAEENTGSVTGKEQSESSATEIDVKGGGTNGSSKKDVKADEGGRLKKANTSSVSEPTGGTFEHNEEYIRENYEKAASDIERILDNVCEKEACRQLEKERTDELNAMAQNISYGDIHKSVNMRVNRIADVDYELYEQYNQIAAPLIKISKQLQRSIIKQLKDRRRGGKMTNLLMGRRMDVHALCRNDGKVFYKNVLPSETPELAVGLLLDESGSMHSHDRATYARASAIILHDFCVSLGIPVMIYGHSTGYDDKAASYTVELYSYAEFEGFNDDDRYRLMDISARESNRDGAALRFVAEQLSKRPEEVKMLIIVSDGQPADSGYFGTAAEEDIRGIRKEYMRKGIIFVAAAIGADKGNIERIYGDSFMDISDLNELPIKLTNVVKRHIRV